MTTLNQQLNQNIINLKSVLDLAVETYHDQCMELINQKFGINTGFDERRALASEVSMMYKRAEEMCKVDDTPHYMKPSPELDKKIKSYIKAPTVKKWDGIFGIGIPGTGMTLWQIVRKLDPNFPTTGRVTQGRKIIKEWAYIPDAETIRQALVYKPA